MHVSIILSIQVFGDKSAASFSVSLASEMSRLCCSWETWLYTKVHSRKGELTNVYTSVRLAFRLEILVVEGPLPAIRLSLKGCMKTVRFAGHMGFLVAGHLLVVLDLCDGLCCIKKLP